jgi:hypothetical protein
MTGWRKDLIVGSSNTMPWGGGGVCGWLKALWSQGWAPPPRQESMMELVMRFLLYHLV